MEIRNIESFFLNTLLRVSIVGVLAILLTDASLYPEDRLSIVIDVIILFACGISYFLRVAYPTVAVLMLTSVVLLAMLYQCLVVPMNTSSSLSVILLVGFIHSVMLKGRTMVIMHSITVLGVALVFALQFLNPGLRFTPNGNELLTVMMTYAILYFILTYAAAILKSGYDRMHQHLRETNIELHKTAKEIESRNEELEDAQTELHVLNNNLERLVNERTAEIQMQNEVMMKYSYANAHHLRGPVARLLGLAMIHRLQSSPDPGFIIDKMAEQAHEIDAVVKQINVDLETGRVVPGDGPGEALKRFR